MKLIEALKKIKYLEKKLDDIKEKIGLFCSDMDYENPVYPDQKNQISVWVQSYRDILKGISSLHYRIANTNINTFLNIELQGKTVNKSIYEWILRRRKLASMELSMYKQLTDKNLREGEVKFSSGQTVRANIRRYYDPTEKDTMTAALSSEPFEIDGKLEVANAITDLI